MSWDTLQPAGKTSPSAPPPANDWAWSRAQEGWNTLQQSLMPAARRPSTRLLLNLPLLCHLGEEQAAWLARRATIRPFRRGMLVTEQGSSEQALYFVLSGLVHTVRRGPKGRTLIIDVLTSGDHFGELGLIDNEAQTTSARCMAPTELLMLRRADFSHCLASSPELLDALTRTLVRRLRQRNRRVAMLALNDVRGCVVQHLVELSELQDGRRVVRKAVNRQTLADMLGASREMVSRIMTELIRSGQVVAEPCGALHLVGPFPD